ncbi:putative alpha-glucan [Phaeomoniella chlamydospora]|uniref:alpha-1,3-glucan synthase n=1 Tax=Phaeomoniella chlamydospora TaxID=158046 RepID=A0A0G2EK81_PHACM|nr:putative alpha-glucan [Phaeomoniella chlamydospora]
MKRLEDGDFIYNLLTEWPANVTINATSSTSKNKRHDSSYTHKFEIADSPAWPYLAWTIEFDPSTLKTTLFPIGSQAHQILIYALLAGVSVITATLGVLLYVQSFYQVKFNKYGVSKSSFLSIFPSRLGQKFTRLPSGPSMQDLRFSEKGKSVASFRIPSTSGPGAEFGLTTNRRSVLIATVEYDIEDWAVKIKIGGLGVMAQLMGKNLGHQDLIWVVPCVGGVDYPENPDEEAEPMAVKILGRTYDIQVRAHILRNITYVLLDAPVFRQQSKSDPYPERMDDLESAIYYSAWNQCIAETIRRYKPDIYHINDYHGAIAPLYLLPDTIPCALSLHNAEFQGLWPMRNEKETNEVCKVYNLPNEVVQEYVQFGEVFNLLHAGASYLRVHQKGFGAVGVSKKYGKRSWARYPIFWGLQTIGALPNPDPSDTAEWNRNDAPEKSKIVVDQAFEAERGELRKKAQEWAGLNIDPEAELFVFVGRWSMQKGIDLIADIFPSILEKHPKTQLIAVGPVIDLYGRFAAMKLDKLMKVFPGRVYSKPEFTALPPFIFSGAEFALIPSRDEPFGLVAVEFGRKGALGVGARVGGLGQMPGWWFTVESTTTKHMLSQFGNAIEDALASKKSVRAQLRARSAKQRFPVAQWVEDLETLQTMSIDKHKKYANKSKRASGHMHRRSASSISDLRSETASRASMSQDRLMSRPASQGRLTNYDSSNAPQGRTRAVSTGSTPDLSLPAVPRIDISRMGSVKGPGHVASHRDSTESLDDARGLSADPFSNGRSAITHNRRLSAASRSGLALTVDTDVEDQQGRHSRARSTSGASIYTLNNQSNDGFDTRLQATYDTPQSFPAWLDNGRLPSISLPEPAASRASSVGPYETPQFSFTQHDSANSSAENLLLNSEDQQYPYKRSRRISNLSVTDIVGESKDFQLQNVAPNFKDQNQDYAREFEARLADLNGKNSNKTTIEEYIEKSEKDWFNRMREVKMGKRASRIFNNGTTQAPYLMVSQADSEEDDQFALQEDYIPPKGIRKFLFRKIGDWPVYSFLLALGQVMAANSYQVTLLTGEVSAPASKLYAVSGIYLGFSIIWWFLYRQLQSRFILAIPFFLYGISFILIGIAPLMGTDDLKSWNQDVGTGFYSAASASGSIFFALNFGDQGGATVTMWVYRACIIQGTQQVYIAGLWWWASTLQRLQNAGTNTATLIVTKPAVVTSVGVSIGVLMWFVGLILFLGLPDYYRQTPGSVPSFFRSIYRRKLILWFFATVLIQNFFLSTLYGRSWLYLWSSPNDVVSTWEIALLALLFFIVIWSLMLYLFSFLSTKHSWIMPLFAIGLGAPRWAQMLWGTSGLGNYLPWTGGAVASVFAGRSLWLWLGVLDSFQGVGFGMILLTTLTRLHVSFTLISAQVIGAAATIVAQAVGPDRNGPGSVFPNFGINPINGISQPWFWIGLACNLGINLVAFKFFRKEQLSKP